MEIFQYVLLKHNIVFQLILTIKVLLQNHTIPIREVRLSSGAEFIVVICGEIMTMPGYKCPCSEFDQAKFSRRN